MQQQPTRYPRSGILTKPLWLHYRVYSGFERAPVFRRRDVMFK